MAYDAGAAFARIEAELIDSMMRNLQRYHLDWEDAEGFDWSQWQVEQLKYLEEYRRQNEKKYGPRFSNINRKIEEAIRHAEENGQKEEELRILRALADHKGLRRRLAGKTPISAAGDAFFRINDRKLEALIEATRNDLQRAEYAVLRRTNDQYRQIIFDAQVYANTGAGTIQKAVDMATHDFLSRGIDCIEYSNGARHTISDWADMAVRTAERRAYLSGEGRKRQEWGVSMVIVNRRGTMTGGNHGRACPQCIPWLGKILIDDVYSGGKADGKHQLLSDAMAAGFLHPRCRDGFTTYFPGISSTPDPATRGEIREAVEAEKEENRESYAQRQAEKFDRLAQYSLDPENKRKYAARAAEWSDRSDEIAERRTQRAAEWKKRHAAPDFSQMDAGQLKEYAENHLKTIFDGLDGANTDYVRETVKVMSRFEEKMGGKTIDGLTVKFGGTPKGVYAKYDDKTKTILLKKTGSIAQFEEIQRSENLRYRIRWKTDKDYHATETFSGTIWHELGHVIDIETGQALSRSLSANAALDEASVKVSAYAGNTQNVRVTKRSEAWAENFAAYMDGGRNKGRVPSKIAEMIEDSFGKKHAANARKSDIPKTKHH